MTDVWLWTAWSILIHCLIDSRGDVLNRCEIAGEQMVDVQLAGVQLSLAHVQYLLDGSRVEANLLCKKLHCLTLAVRWLLAERY
jgi:hypothetical protein